MVTVLGIPLDENASFLRGAAQAPGHIRAALHSGAMNLCAEDGRDLATAPGWRDIGDLTLDGCGGAFAQIKQVVASHVRAGERLLALGGDHAITYPIIQGYAEVYPDMTILHIDAHPDLYDEYEHSRNSHACPFARIMESGLARKLVQVGIRAMTPHQREQADRFGVTVVEMKDWHPGLELPLEGPLYLSLDLDALDPAFAPGVSHPEPGGLTTREVLAIIQGLQVPLVGADLVEFNPTRDPAGITAALAAKCYKESIAQMLE
ncbi:MAG: agmatinase [Chloroflexota bacterium]